VSIGYSHESAFQTLESVNSTLCRFITYQSCGMNLSFRFIAGINNETEGIWARNDIAQSIQDDNYLHSGNICHSIIKAPDVTSFPLCPRVPTLHARRGPHQSNLESGCGSTVN